MAQLHDRYGSASRGIAGAGLPTQRNAVRGEWQPPDGAPEPEAPREFPPEPEPLPEQPEPEVPSQPEAPPPAPPPEYPDGSATTDCASASR
jgi:hypothetical protein